MSLPANPAVADAMAILEVRRTEERAAEVALAKLLFGGEPYRTDAHIAACQALTNARDAVIAAERGAAAAAFSQLREPLCSPSSSASSGSSVITEPSVPAPRRSRRIAASASKREAAAAAQREADLLIDSFLIQEEMDMVYKKGISTIKAHYESKLAQLNEQHNCLLASYNAALTDARAASDAFFCDAFCDARSVKNMQTAHFMMRDVIRISNKLAASNYKIKKIQDAIAAL